MDIADDEDFLADDEREYTPSLQDRHSVFESGTADLINTTDSDDAFEAQDTDDEEEQEQEEEYEEDEDQDTEDKGTKGHSLNRIDRRNLLHSHQRMPLPLHKTRQPKPRLNNFFLRRIKDKFPLPPTSGPSAFSADFAAPDTPTTESRVLDLDDQPLDLRSLREALAQEYDDETIPNEQIKHRCMLQALRALRSVLVADLNRLDWRSIESALVMVQTSLHSNTDPADGKGVLRAVPDNPRQLLISPQQASFISPASSPKSLTLSRRGLRAFMDGEGTALLIHFLSLVWSSLALCGVVTAPANPVSGHLASSNSLFSDAAFVRFAVGSADHLVMARSACLMVQIVEDTLSFSDVDSAHLVAALIPPILMDPIRLPVDVSCRVCRMLALLCSPESDYCASALKTPLVDSFGVALSQNHVDPMVFQWIAVCIQRISWSDQSSCWTEQSRSQLIVSTLVWINLFSDNVDCVYVGIQTVASLLLRFSYSDIDMLIPPPQASRILYLAREYSDDPQIIDSVASFFLSLRGFGSKAYFCDTDVAAVASSVIETLEFCLSQSNIAFVPSFVRLLKELSFRDDFVQLYVQCNLGKVLMSITEMEGCDGSLLRLIRSLLQKIQEIQLL